jgi:hypothetical protein
MSTHIIGFRPPDEKWKKMKEVWDRCNELKIEPPKEVKDFFQGEEPDPNGIEVNIPTRKWENEYGSGFEIMIKDIPKDIEIIRFYNSW